MSQNSGEKNLFVPETQLVSQVFRDGNWVTPTPSPLPSRETPPLPQHQGR